MSIERVSIKQNPFTLCNVRKPTYVFALSLPVLHIILHSIEQDIAYTCLVACFPPTLAWAAWQLGEKVHGVPVCSKQLAEQQGGG